jgi:hypothetical protein
MEPPVRFEYNQTLWSSFSCYKIALAVEVIMKSKASDEVKQKLSEITAKTNSECERITNRANEVGSKKYSYRASPEFVQAVSEFEIFFKLNGSQMRRYLTERFSGVELLFRSSSSIFGKPLSKYGREYEQLRSYYKIVEARGYSGFLTMAMSNSFIHFVDI